jgi:hypothetical protein
MKNTILILVGLLFFVTACGTEKLKIETNKNRTFECPMLFEKNNLCARMDWKQGPSADSESSFELHFWNKEGGKKAEDLMPRLSVFLRMTCCGTVKVPKTTALSPDRYLINQIPFTPGKWEVHVQLKGEKAEESVVLVSLDDK